MIGRSERGWGRVMNPITWLPLTQSETDKLLGLMTGADDFIRKPFSPRVLVERVGAVLRRPRSVHLAGYQQYSDDVIERGHLRMDKERYACTWKGSPVELTAIQFRLLESLAIRPAKVQSRDALIEIACGDDVDSRTVDSHMKRLRQKFRAVYATFNEIQSVYGAGYRFSRSSE